MFTGITAPSSLLHELIIGIHILYIYLLKTEHMKFLIKQLQIIKEPLPHVCITYMSCGFHLLYAENCKIKKLTLLTLI